MTGKKLDYLDREHDSSDGRAESYGNCEGRDNVHGCIEE